MVKDDYALISLRQLTGKETALAAVRATGKGAREPPTAPEPFATGLARDLQLRQPKYNVTAAYCHFGREPYEKDGMKFFSWENAKDLKKYAGMDSAQVSAALQSSNYLTKWVD